MIQFRDDSKSNMIWSQKGFVMFKRTNINVHVLHARIYETFQLIFYST